MCLLPSPTAAGRALAIYRPDITAPVLAQEFGLSRSSILTSHATLRPMSPRPTDRPNRFRLPPGHKRSPSRPRMQPRATSGVHFFGPGSRLPSALLEGATAHPTLDHPLMIPAAMIAYTLVPASGERGHS